MNSFGNINGFISNIIAVDGLKIKVNILGIQSDFIPLMQTYNSFKSCYTPPQIGQQVLVLQLDDFMIAFGDIPSKDTLLKEINPTKDIINYQDGTTLSYDIQTHTLEIDSIESIVIKAKDVQVISNNASIKSESVYIESNNINLGSEGGGGVLTTQCIDPFTGSPFPQGSLKVKASL